MGVLLEVKAGPLAGKQIPLTTGQSIVIGRAKGKAGFAVPEDTFMSGGHFAVECGMQGCRVQDRKSSNGTFLNGARIQDAMLANGDEIKAGQTVFSVRMLSDEKIAALLSSQAGTAPAAPPAVSRAAGSSDAGRVPAEEASAKPSKAAEPAPRHGSQLPPHSEPLTAGAKSDLSSPSRAKQPANAQPPASVSNPGSSAVPASPAPLAAPPNASAQAKSEGRRGPGTSGGAEKQAASHSGAFAVSIMGWSFPRIPAKWQVQEGLGLQAQEGDFPSSLAATQESLGGITLPEFVEFQINMLKNYLRDPAIEPVVPLRISGGEETLALDVRHKTKDGKELVYRRIYARNANAVGVLTVTALASELPQVMENLAPALNGVSFQRAAA